MENAAILSICGAVAIAISCSFFGVAVARMVWAEDLQHTLQLKQTWDEIDKLNKETIKILKRRLGE